MNEGVGWVKLQNGQNEKTQILRRLELKSKTEGAGSAKEPKNPCTKKRSIKDKHLFTVKQREGQG